MPPCQSCYLVASMLPCQSCHKTTKTFTLIEFEPKKEKLSSKIWSKPGPLYLIFVSVILLRLGFLVFFTWSLTLVYFRPARRSGAYRKARCSQHKNRSRQVGQHCMALREPCVVGSDFIWYMYIIVYYDYYIIYIY